MAKRITEDARIGILEENFAVFGNRFSELEAQIAQLSSAASYSILPRIMPPIFFAPSVARKEVPVIQLPQCQPIVVHASPRSEVEILVDKAGVKIYNSPTPPDKPPELPPQKWIAASGWTVLHSTKGSATCRKRV